MDSIISYSLAAVPIVKIVIGLTRMVGPVSRWAPPLLALVSGPAAIVLLIVAEKGAGGIDSQLIAQAILGGILAAGTAVGIHEIDQRAKPTIQ
ncbi:MAG: hypothetical protein EPO26_07270 [Chloroflexota bacterium]|nr:MAG: hypothetical protein EPO26_07270 [Chloroflexota bacterium]